MANSNQKVGSPAENNVFETLVRHSYLVIAAVIFVSFGLSVFNGYNIDDEYVVENHELVKKGIAGLPEIFSQPYIQKRGESYEYRPLTIATFAVEYSLFKENVFINHLINVLLFIACTILLFRILTRLLGRRFPAIIILLLTVAWAAHPVHAEVVCSLKNREEILSFLFAFGAILLLIRSFDKALKWYEIASMLLLVVLSLLSKRAAVPLMGISALSALYFYFRTRKNKTVPLASILIILISAVFSIVNIYYSKRQINFFEDPMVKMVSIAEILSYKLSILPAYFKLLFFPFQLSFYYGYNAVPYGTWSTVFPYVGILVILLTISPLWFIKKGRELYMIALIFLYGTLGLYLLISYTGIISERALFITVLPFLFLLVFLLMVGIKNGSTAKRISIYFLLFITSVYSVRSAHRSLQWKDKRTLLSSDIDHLEKSYLANYIYATHLYYLVENDKSGDTAVINPIAREALKHYSIAVSMFPKEDFLSYIHMGDINFKHLNDFPAAVDNYRASIQLGVDREDIQLSLGMAAFKIGQHDESRKALDAVLAKDSMNQDALYFNIQNLLYLGKLTEARSLQKRYRAKYADLYRADLNEGRISLREGRTEEAIKYFEAAVEKGLRDRKILMNLASYYKSRGESLKQNYYASLAFQEQSSGQE